jgi:hypothetical protein
VVQVLNVNRAPTVTVTGGRRVTTGEHVTVSGSAQDSDGDALTYAWSQVSGPPVVLEGAMTPVISFDAPAATETDQLIALQLVASDGHDASQPGRVELVLVGVPKQPTPSPTATGCTCSSVVEGWAGLALLAWVRRARRRSTLRR